MRKENYAIKISLRTSILLLLCFINISVANAQTNKPDSTDNLEKNKPAFTHIESPDAPPPCEAWLSYFTNSLFIWHEYWKNDNNSTLIVVARAGKNESRRANLKRIKTLKEYILAPKRKIKAVIVEGDRVEGYGVVEIYVEGKLFISLPLHKNENLPFEVCNP